MNPIQEDRQEDHQAEMIDIHAITIIIFIEEQELTITHQTHQSQMYHLRKGTAKTMRKTRDITIE